MVFAVKVDGLGTPLRSKEFRVLCYGNPGDGGGIEDHVAAIKQLPERWPSMFLEKAGIYGPSSVGYSGFIMDASAFCHRR